MSAFDLQNPPGSPSLYLRAPPLVSRRGISARLAASPSHRRARPPSPASPMSVSPRLRRRDAAVAGASSAAPDLPGLGRWPRGCICGPRVVHRRIERATGTPPNAFTGHSTASTGVGCGRDGARFLADHEYARDLDLFGRLALPAAEHGAHGNRRGDACRLAAAWRGDRRGARPAGAVEELRPHVDFREDVAVAAAGAEASRTGALARWAGAPPVGSPRLLPGVGACALCRRACRAGTGSAPCSFALAGCSSKPFSCGMASVVSGVVHRSKTGSRPRILADLLAAVEAALSAPRLAACGPLLGARAGLARYRAAQRAGFVARSSTHNLLFMPMTRALLVPEQLAIAIDRWHAAMARRRRLAPRGRRGRSARGAGDLRVRASGRSVPRF